MSILLFASGNSTHSKSLEYVFKFSKIRNNFDFSRKKKKKKRRRHYKRTDFMVYPSNWTENLYTRMTQPHHIKSTYKNDCVFVSVDRYVCCQCVLLCCQLFFSFCVHFLKTLRWKWQTAAHANMFDDTKRHARTVCHCMSGRAQVHTF